jgi:hypothetical protein
LPLLLGFCSISEESDVDRVCGCDCPDEVATFAVVTSSISVASDVFSVCVCATVLYLLENELYLLENELDELENELPLPE